VSATTRRPDRQTRRATLEPGTTASRLDAIETRRICAWCEGPIPADARSDAIYCATRCRQASHRFRAGYAPRPRATDEAMRFAYADPPYPGKSARYYREHPDYKGEVDHEALIRQLEEEYPDGWAVSTSAEALPLVLGYCTTAVGVAAWFRGERPTKSGRPLNAWEPVVFAGGRYATRDAGDARRIDALVHVSRARLTDPKRVTGTKPAKFLWWLFDLLGARPGDELADLFPGSGGVGRAWRIFCEGPPQPSRLESRQVA
jgi:hypothetical protein